LLGIALIRAVIVRRFPMARERRFALALIAFLFLGVTLAAREYRTELTETQALIKEVESLRDYSDVARLRDQGNPEWRAHGTTAVPIFERTTKISGHQASHDEAKASSRRF
jgi:hypothetical protein